MKEYQEARDQCGQQLPELEEVLKSKYARFVQEDEENNRREFAKKYPNISEFFRFEGEKKKALIKQLLSIMRQKPQKEWRIEELHDATGLPLDDRFTIFRS